MKFCLVILDNVLYILRALLLLFFANPSKIHATNVSVYIRYKFLLKTEMKPVKETVSAVRGEAKAL